MDGGIPTEGSVPVQEVQPTKSGLDGLLDRLQKPTEEQRKLLQDFKDGKTEKTPEVDTAIDAERDERVKENLPTVVKFYRGVYQRRLEKARSGTERPLYSGEGRYMIQHEIKILKDLSKLLDFKSWGEGVTDQQAQDIALEGLFKIMYDSYGLGPGRSRNMAGEEHEIKRGADPESPEIKSQLARLYELEGRHDTLTDDLFYKFKWHPWFNLRYSKVISIDQKESTLPIADIQAFNVDPDYYNAYYTKYFSSNQWSSEVYKYNVLQTGVIPEDVTQRIVSKWEQPPAQPTPQKTFA